MPQPLVISIDYDLTFTADPVLWSAFVDAAVKRGHKVICVTGRHRPPCLDRDPQFPGGVEIICAPDVEKRKAAERAGYKVNIWVDDMPETIAPALLLNFD